LRRVRWAHRVQRGLLVRRGSAVRLRACLDPKVRWVRKASKAFLALLARKVSRVIPETLGLPVRRATRAMQESLVQSDPLVLVVPRVPLVPQDRRVILV
jgi:hypothetical protein